MKNYLSASFFWYPTKVTLIAGISLLTFLVPKLAASDEEREKISSNQRTAIIILPSLSNLTEVESSPNEGRPQQSLGKKPSVQPLLEHSRFEPTDENKTIKQLLEATSGSTKIHEEDMLTQDLPLPVTPLAASRNGEKFQHSLARLTNKEPKDQLLRHFFHSLTDLVSMHDKRVSHIDIKPTNILINADGVCESDGIYFAPHFTTRNQNIGRYKYNLPSNGNYEGEIPEFYNELQKAYNKDGDRYTEPQLSPYDSSLHNDNEPETDPYEVTEKPEFSPKQHRKAKGKEIDSYLS